MPRAGRHVDDVAFAGDERLLTFERVADPAGEDEPELGALGVEVPLVVRIERRQVLLVAVDDSISDLSSRTKRPPVYFSFFAAASWMFRCGWLN